MIMENIFKSFKKKYTLIFWYWSTMVMNDFNFSKAQKLKKNPSKKNSWVI